MSKQPLRLPHYPKILSDEVLAALRICRALGLEGTRMTHYLKVFRMKYPQQPTMVQRIAIWGIKPVIDDEGTNRNKLRQFPFHPEIAKKLENLDKAFKKLHHYDQGGWKDYVAHPVAAEINRQMAKYFRTDALRLLMEEIMENDSSIDIEGMMTELKKRIDNKLIYSVTDKVEWYNGTDKTTPTSRAAIAQRMTEIRQSKESGSG